MTFAAPNLFVRPIRGALASKCAFNAALLDNFNRIH
jgi:hypothetical protein